MENKSIGGAPAEKVPTAVKFYLFRTPCGPGGSTYHGGLVKKSPNWIPLIDSQNNYR